MIGFVPDEARLPGYSLQRVTEPSPKPISAPTRAPTPAAIITALSGRRLILSAAAAAASSAAC
jgi:hypothetical protein